ncbi:MAG: MarR family transcriptional regulator [Paraglaciecola sp.]|uniref:MarR family winged helix-turn-helix transcriptional regulator n=1 Tax=Rheinheimera sp. UJ63 TaxID=2910157 RepID=UPI001F20964E|nr:MarR family transcriptional regulator [Rheinheimera sp. UJ63]MCF4010002.1 MarR family transcriptional regulator [Rheinheimera sp. UJ63]MDP5133735.1 MarR family transcriptional regulator [Paraglaciecola sp.]
MPRLDAKTGKSQLDLERYLPAIVTYLANKLSSGASVCYRKHFGVGVAEWRLLALLKVEQNITANRMSQVIGLDKAAVSRALQSLLERKAVTYQKDSNDGRSVLVTLTPEGVLLHDQILDVALQREALLLEDLEPEEINQLITLLQKIKKRITAVNAYEPSDNVHGSEDNSD